MARKTPVGGDVVRAWAQEAGEAVGLRGRFSKDLLDKFHAANRDKVYEKGHVQSIKVTGKRTTSNGRTIPVTVKATVPEIRKFAKANGFQVGARGRISADVKAAFAATPR